MALGEFLRFCTNIKQGDKPLKKETVLTEWSMEPPKFSLTLNTSPNLNLNTDKSFLTKLEHASF